jgi:hypothetical protein
MGYIIAYTGTHGTGKTTAAMQRGMNEKLANTGKSVHVLCNQENLCPFPINRKATPESQLWIFTNQLHQELTLISRFDIVVSDRTILDVIAYTHVLGYHSLAHSMVFLACCHASIYQEVIFRRMATNGFCYPDGVREARDQRFRAEVERELQIIYSELASSGSMNGSVIRYE